jgi:hypothetical protein
LFVNRFSLGKPLVVIVGYIYGTYFDAVSATGALVKIDISRMLHDAGGKMSGFAFDPQQITVCQKLDV